MEFIKYIFDMAFISFWYFCGVAILLAITGQGLSETILAIGKSIHLFIMGVKGIPVDMTTVIINRKEDEKQQDI